MNLESNTQLALMQASQTNSAGKLSDAKQAASEKDVKRMNEVAKDFEAMFMTEMLKPMFAELKPDARFGGGKGEEIFQGFMLQEYGKMIAETQSLGIADQVKGQLVQMQAEANGNRDPLPAAPNEQQLKAYNQQDASLNSNNNTIANNQTSYDPLTAIIEEQINVQ